MKKGQQMTPAQRAHLSQARKGMVFSEEHKRNISLHEGTGLTEAKILSILQGGGGSHS
jgi:hypothetical protein